jgi:hypothetical protein
VVEKIFSSQALETVELTMLDNRIDYMVASKKQQRQVKLGIKISSARIDELF